MTRADALKILRDYQRWRRDDDAGDDAMPEPMPEPRLIGLALDVAIAELAKAAPPATCTCKRELSLIWMCCRCGAQVQDVTP